MTSKARGLANLGNAYSDGALSNRNMIINGGMQVAQRGTSFAGPQGYTLDRFKSIRYATSGYTVSQQDSGLEGFGKCVRVQRDSGNTSSNTIGLNQAVEQVDTTHLKGKEVILSCWIRVGSNFSSTATDQFFLSLSWTTSGTEIGMNYAYFSASSGSSVAQLNGTVDSTWRKFTVATTLPSGATQVGFGMQASTYIGTAGANDYFEVTGVQLELGDTATPFEHRSYGDELARCQRYYYQVTLNPNEYINLTRFAGNTGVPFGRYELPVEMRGVPTLAQSGSWTSGSGYSGTPTLYAGSNKAVRLHGASVAANVTVYAANGTITADAEL